MNGLQIERFVRRFCRDKFHGVFSCDTLPPNPQLLVCNTDPHDSPELIGLSSTWTRMDVESTLTHSGWNHLLCLKTT
mgnify:CR=1 FL=1